VLPKFSPEPTVRTELAELNSDSSVTVLVSVWAGVVSSSSRFRLSEMFEN
jgi:hypothetical protein